jgi:hypothetical protein
MESEPTCNHCDCENCVQHVTLEEFVRTFGTIGVARAVEGQPALHIVKNAEVGEGPEETGYDETIDAQDTD